MNRKWVPFAIAGGIAVLLIALLVGKYNSMVTQSESVDNSWAQVQNVLQRRADLIPNLVNTVKGYAAHEKEVFENVSAARSAAISAQGPAAQAQAETALNGALGRLFAVAEAYPQLRAAESFTQLQQELANTEDQIAASRRIYNGNVQAYNTKIQVFPNSLLAGPFGFTRREFFEIEDPADREPVKVSF